MGKVELGPHAVDVWDAVAPGWCMVWQVASEHGVGEAVQRLAVVRGFVLRALVGPELVEREYGVVAAACVGERSRPGGQQLVLERLRSRVIRRVPAEPA